MMKHGLLLIFRVLFIPMEVLFRKLGRCSGKEVSFCSVSAGTCFLMGITFKWGVGEDNQHMWDDGRSQRALLYVIVKDKDCR